MHRKNKIHSIIVNSLRFRPIKINKKYRGLIKQNFFAFPIFRKGIFYCLKVFLKSGCTKIPTNSKQLKGVKKWRQFCRQLAENKIMILKWWRHFYRHKNFFKKPPQFAPSQCKHNERTFWILCKHFGFRAYKRLLSVGISEGIFKFSLKNHPNLPFLSANIMKGNFKFYENRLYKTLYEIPNKWEKFLPFIKK